MLIKAHTIIPIEGPDFSPGVLEIKQNTISAIGDESLLGSVDQNQEILDLSDHVLFPGFVNAHSHLELTAIGPLKQHDFLKWILELIQLKNQMDENEMVRGIKDGISALLRSGVTTIGDHVSFNTPLSPLIQSPFRGILFGEVLGVIPEVCQDIYHTFKNTRKIFESRNSLLNIHLSPHSIHAVDPLVLQTILNDEEAPLSCHIAESQYEYDYFKNQTGPLMELIKSRGIEPPHKTKSAFEFLKTSHLPFEKLLFIHGNYFSESEIDTIGKKNISLVHCPGSHQFFNHHSFSIQEYKNRGINIAIGTDSIASNQTLNFIEEMKIIKNRHPSLSARSILEMATINGARALRMDNQIGCLEPGKKADICGFAMIDGTLEEIPLKSTKCDFLMIDGKRIIG